MGTKAVRLIDLAHAAKVSISTASQVMNNSGRVAAATRQRVLETAERLDYRPNALARSVASGRSNTIGILAENASGSFCMPVLVGTNRALSQLNYASVLYDAAHSKKLRREHVRQLQARHVDGIIIIGEGSDQISASITDDFAGPVVYAFGRSDEEADASFVPDDYQGGRMAADHLVQLGRTKLLHVTAQSHLLAVQDRARGFADALADQGIQPVRAPIFGEFSRESGFEAARAIGSDGVDCDGVFAGNDEIAIGLCAQLQAQGVDIPGDIAVVGFDNAAAQAGHDLYLTSIDPNLVDVGARAVESLVGALRGELELPALTAIACSLVASRSTLGGPESPRSLVMESLIS